MLTLSTDTPEICTSPDTVTMEPRRASSWSEVMEADVTVTLLIVEMPDRDEIALITSVVCDGVRQM